MYKQPISTLTAISAGTIFKSRRQILKQSIVLDRFISRINTWKEQRKPTWSCFKASQSHENVRQSFNKLLLGGDPPEWVAQGPHKLNPALVDSSGIWTHWERCAHLIQFKCTRYSRDDLTVFVRIYSVSILFQNHPQRNLRKKNSSFWSSKIMKFSFVFLWGWFWNKAINFRHIR